MNHVANLSHGCEVVTTGCTVHSIKCLYLKSSRRLRTDKAKNRHNIDGVVALAMAAETPIATAAFHGWLDCWQ